MHHSLCCCHIVVGNVATFPLLVCIINVAGTHLVGDMVLPCRSCCAGCGRQMWVKVAVGDGDDDMMVVMRQRW